jgi:hypothetical protein
VKRSTVVYLKQAAPHRRIYRRHATARLRERALEAMMMRWFLRRPDAELRKLAR